MTRSERCCFADLFALFWIKRIVDFTVARLKSSAHISNNFSRMSQISISLPTKFHESLSAHNFSNQKIRTIENSNWQFKCQIGTNYVILADALIVQRSLTWDTIGGYITKLLSQMGTEQVNRSFAEE